MTPKTFTIPGAAAFLERFLRPAAATSGEGVEIRQDGHGTIVSVIEGRHAATITTPEAGDLEPILVDPAALAQADPTKPVKVYRMAESAGTIVSAGGDLVDLKVAPGILPQSARDIADCVEGEVASGMTRAVFEVDPHHLLAVAEAMISAGVKKTAIVAAPRWNVLAITGKGSGTTLTFMIAGEAFNAAPSATDATIAVIGESEDGAADPLTFTIGGGRREAKQTGRRQPPKPCDYPLDELPF